MLCEWICVCIDLILKFKSKIHQFQKSDLVFFLFFTFQRSNLNAKLQSIFLLQQQGMMQTKQNKETPLKMLNDHHLIQLQSMKFSVIK